MAKMQGGVVKIAKSEEHPQFGEEKLFLESPYEAKDALSSLDWEKCHRTWSASKDWTDEDKMWMVDADSIDYVESHLEEQGWQLRDER